MNFSQKCACVISFIFGMILSMVLHQSFYSNSFIYTSTIPNCDMFRSLATLKESVNELIISSGHHNSAHSQEHSTTEDTAQLEPLRKQSGDSAKSIKKLGLLCVVLTGPNTNTTRTISVKETWGKRCDKLLFISTEQDNTLPTTVIKGATEGRNGLWSKTRGAFKLIYEKYLDKFDYFMKTDTDTFVIVENLRHYLSGFNSSVPNFFGCLFEIKTKKKGKLITWHSGGAGYVLSKAAVKSMIEKGFKHSKCKKSADIGPEDVNIARCLQAANVTFVDTRDKLGRYRFNGYPAKHYIIPNAIPSWWKEYIKYPQKSGMECCSENAITFHYVAPNEMYLYEFLLYHLRPYGIHNNNDTT